MTGDESGFPSSRRFSNKESTIELINNGKIAYLYLPASMQYHKIDLLKYPKLLQATASDQPTINPYFSFDKGSAQFICSSKLMNIPVWVLSYTSSTSKGKTGIVYVSKASYDVLEVKMNVNLTVGKGTAVYHLLHQTLNAPDPPSEFQFKVPQGATEASWKQMGMPQSIVTNLLNEHA